MTIGPQRTWELKSSDPVWAVGNCAIAGYDSLRGTPYFQWDMRVGKRIALRERAALGDLLPGLQYHESRELRRQLQ